jgi:tight adherence protein B
MAPVLLPILVFLFAAGAIFGIYAAVTYLPAAFARRRIEERIRDAAAAPFAPDTEGESVLKRQAEGPLPLIDRLLANSVKGAGLARLIEQAGLKTSVSTILVASIILGLMGAVVIQVAVRQTWAVFAGVGVGCVSPFLYLRHRRSARLKRFEEQFPEALDLVSRAIRAGHAFTTAMGMVAEEGADPVGQEFRKSFDEQNFGLPLKDALNNLAERVPSLDVRFFVTAVLIQRETGGNLAEILDNLAHVVRERFKILRQVRVYTAHGRLTGYVLMTLPAALAFVLQFINPEHMNLLFRERMGHIMLTVAIVLQIIGYFWIKRAVKIEV